MRQQPRRRGHRGRKGRGGPARGPTAGGGVGGGGPGAEPAQGATASQTCSSGQASGCRVHPTPCQPPCTPQAARGGAPPTSAGNTGAFPGGTRTAGRPRLRMRAVDGAGRLRPPWSRAGSVWAQGDAGGQGRRTNTPALLALPPPAAGRRRGRGVLTRGVQAVLQAGHREPPAEQGGVGRQEVHALQRALAVGAT